jgi:hypothetical protein
VDRYNCVVSEKKCTPGCTNLLRNAPQTLMCGKMVPGFHKTLKKITGFEKKTEK